MSTVQNKNTKVVETYRYLKKSDYFNRVLCFLVDVCVSICPMMIWNIVTLAVLGSVLSYFGMKVLNIVITVCMLITILFANARISEYTKGQSLGMYFYHMRLITLNGHKANKRQIYVRNIVGFAIPFILLMFYTSIFGIALYWLIDVTVLMIDKKHRQIIDFLTNTTVVMNYKKAVVEKPVEKEVVKPVSTPVNESVALNGVDLHIHSIFSPNGEYTIEEIFQYAKRNEMKTISITDLNTSKTIANARRLSALYDINYIPGVEILADYYGHTISLLGYFLSANSELFTTLENNALLHEKEASLERVKRFESYLGKRIDLNEMALNNRFQIISGEMIAKHVLTHEHYYDCDLLKAYRNCDLETAIKRLEADYFAPGKACYVKTKRVPAQDALDILELSNAVVVLGNPYALYHEQPELFENFISKGIVGIEAFRPDYREDQMKEMMKVAMKHKLLITCGSDFYKETKDEKIGLCKCPKAAEAMIDQFIYSK